MRTTCAYCGVGCGILATPRQDGTVAIAGDSDHPANFGRLCTKGSSLGDTLGHGHRLLHPMIGGQRVGWGEATRAVADAFSAAIRDHGPESVAFYVSGQLLTEDYYVANKLMKGFIGSANIDTNSRLCMASAVAGHKRAFGTDVVPCDYTDLEEADLVVLVGSNMAWCHPVLFQRLQDARRKHGTILVVIDPRRSATADEADLHLALKPGSDVALFNGLLADLSRRGAMDAAYVSRHTSGLTDALQEAGPWTLQRVAAATGVEAPLIQRFYDFFARTLKTVTAFSMGVNQSRDGTDKVNAIINCHLATGRIGKPGAGPFSLTGQPNAMGGREVGGLANMLAAHMEIGDPGHRKIVQDHWQAPRLAERAGLKAAELFDAVRDGRIKALWIMATNPAVSMPQSDVTAEALKRCPFVVVSDVVADSETARYAHVLLPAAGWGEKDGTVTNSERRISRQRKFASPPGEARPDWKIVCDVATAMGCDGFDYGSPAAIFREHAALSGKSNNNERAFNIRSQAVLTDGSYDRLAPFQWLERPFRDGRSHWADGRMRFVATPYWPRAAAPGEFVLNTGRIRDQWHTMTRTGTIARLFSVTAEPFVHINPADAERLSLNPADLAVVTGRGGEMVLRVHVSDSVRPGSAFAPIHWSSPFSSHAVVNHASGNAVDPVSGQPELKSSPVSISRYPARWYGFIVSRHAVPPIGHYWASRPVAGGMALECAGHETDGAAAFAAAVRSLSPHGEASVASDSANGRFRAAFMSEQGLEAAVFVSSDPVEADRSFVVSQLGEQLAAIDILCGRSATKATTRSRMICICNGVEADVIDGAIRETDDLAKVCERTGAGTSCGSCKLEIRRMMEQVKIFREAAE